MSAQIGSEPLNLLALDGGGIRGVSELVILHEIMLQIQEREQLAKLPKPCEYFHLIGGTSTGGLVAIMLGRLDMSTEEALRAYDTFASQIFSNKNRKMNGQRWTQMYKATGLRNTVQQLVEEQSKGEWMRDSKNLHDKGRSFVCAKHGQEHRRTERFRTYDAEGDLFKHVKIWEAARATTAAPIYFKPMTITNDNAVTQDFVDAAMGCNNPTEILLEEADLLYGKQRKLGCVISLGTGTRRQELAESSTGFSNKVRWAKQLITVMKDITVDCEDTHARVEKRLRHFSNAYFRFNVAGGAEGIKLEDWSKMDELKRRTQAYLQEDQIRKKITDLVDIILRTHEHHGLTVGHVVGLDESNLVLDTNVAISRGRASRIFTGREKILRQMERHFAEGGPGGNGRKEFLLRGVGGVGKTQIALQFADLNDRRFRIFWIDATNSITIEQSYRKYGERMATTQEAGRSVQQVIQWLEETDVEWLLIFDNAPKSNLRQYIPDGNRGNIIFTSRFHSLEQRFRPESVQDVDCMEPDDAVTLLLKAANIDHTDEGARRTGKLIVDELGCLPLAIDQAGAYVHTAPCRLDQFLKIYNKQKVSLLKNPPFKGEDEIRNLPIYTTFNISLEAIQAYAARRRDVDKVQDAVSAIQLISIFCFYHNEGLMKTMFHLAAEYRAKHDRNRVFPLVVGDHCLNELVTTTDGIWDSTNFDRGLNFLQDFSLVKVDSTADHTTMHILVHEWARGRLDPSLRAQYGLVARSILFDSIWFKEKTAPAVYRRNTLPHFEVCLKYVRNRHENDILESEYDAKYALTQKEACNFREAEAALKRAIYTRQFEFSLLGSETQAAMAQLGDVYLQQGHYGNAEAMLLEVIARREMALRDQKYETLIRTKRQKKQGFRNRSEREKTKPDNTGRTCDVIEEPEEQDAAFGYAALPGVDKNDLEALDDPKLRFYKLRLCGVYIQQDQIGLAATCMTDVVRGLERKHGVRSDNIFLQDARSNLKRLENTLAGTYQKEPSESEKLRKVVDVGVRLYGHTDPRTMRCKRRLAVALGNEGQFKEASRFWTEVFDYFDKIYGETAPETMRVAEEIALMFEQWGQHTEAESVRWLVLDAHERNLGTNHPETLWALQYVARSLARQARVDEALPLMKKCAEQRAVVLGRQHRTTKMTERLVAQLLHLRPVATSGIRTLLENERNENMRSTLGEYSPEWLKEWEPTPVDIDEAELDDWNTTVQLTKELQITSD